MRPAIELPLKIISGARLEYKGYRFHEQKTDRLPISSKLGFTRRTYENKAGRSWYW